MLSHSFIIALQILRSVSFFDSKIFEQLKDRTKKVFSLNFISYLAFCFLDDKQRFPINFYENIEKNQLLFNPFLGHLKFQIFLFSFTFYYILAFLDSSMADTQCEGPPEKKARSEIDCQQCGLVKSKYTCPKCTFRTCSLPCVKLHKEANNCDGQRKPFDVVKKFSQFNDNISVKDQEYMSTLKSAVSGGIQSTNVTVEQFRNSNTILSVDATNVSNVSSAIDDHHDVTADSFSNSVNDREEEEPIKTAFTPGSQPFNSNNNAERFLVSNAARRHIFLNSSSGLCSLFYIYF